MADEGSVEALLELQLSWKLFVDGSSNKERFGVGIILLGPKGE